MDVFLLRHGQSEYNIGLTDHLDSALTDLGQQQASLTALRLLGENIGHVYVSPLRRTLQTIAPFCQMSGLNAEVAADACEYFSTNLYAHFPGRDFDTIQSEFPFAVANDLFQCDPIWWPQQVETDALIYARAERMRDSLLARFAGTDIHVLIVSHADTVGRLIEAFLRVPPKPDDPPWSDNCGLSRLACDPDRQQPATRVYQNDTSHLSGLPL